MSPSFALIGYAAAGALIVGTVGGWKVRDWQCDAAQAKALERALEQREELERRLHSLAVQYEEERYNAGEAYANRQVEIRTRFRDRVVPADCAVPDSVVRVLESSVSAANARTGREPDAELREPAVPPNPPD
jgi:hypothetical protein